MVLERLPMKVGTLALLALPLLLPISEVQAQEVGWAPFLGCWEPESADTEGVLCFVPNGDQVDMLTIADGEVAFREHFAADGANRSIDQDGCSGTEMARFSEDRERIYTYSDLACEDGARKSSGIIAMVGPTAWLDIRSLEGEDGPVAWVQGYRRADSSALTDLGFDDPTAATGRTAFRGIRRGAGVARMDVDDVIDASNAVDQQAVQAWLVESGQGIDRLNADDLITMDDAGVDGDVIDVVVAASFPGHFALDRGDRQARNAYGRRLGARPIFLGPGYGRYYDPFYSGFGYSSFYGYGGYGHPYYGGGYYYRPVIQVGRTDGGGRAVNGRGYRRSGGSSTGSTGGSRRQPAASPSGGSTRSQPARGSRGKAKRRRGGR